MDYADKSVAELRELEAAITGALKDAKKRDRNEAIDKINKIASDYGFTVAELFGDKLGKKSLTVRPPKYRDPKDPLNTWTGAGRRPNWFRKHIDDGGTLEELEI